MAKLLAKHSFMSALLIITVSCDRNRSVSTGLHSLDNVIHGRNPGTQPSNPPGTIAPTPSLALAPLSTYATCQDLKVDLKAILTVKMTYEWNEHRYWRSYWSSRGAERDANASADAGTSAMPVSAAAASSTSAAPAPTVVGTNLQVAGVDEGDEIKITPRAIYITDNQSLPGAQRVHIVGTSPLAYLGDLTINSLTSPKLYTDQQRLVAIGTATQPTMVGSIVRPTPGTEIDVYDASAAAVPKLLHTFKSSGQLVDSRLVNGRLYVALRDTLEPLELPDPSAMQHLDTDLTGFLTHLDIDRMFTFTDSTINGITCTSMVKFPGYLKQLQFQRLLSYDVASGSVLSDVTIAGNGDTLYMTDQTMYTVGKPDQPPIWVDPTPGTGIAPVAASAADATYDTLIVTKIDVNQGTGILKPAARGTVAGHLKLFDSPWAFNELPSGDSTALAVVTSTGDVRDTSGHNPARNHLTILKQQGKDLVAAGSLTGFGNNEDVRSVRYIGTKAYVVTFERTDPLYTIDLSDQTKPKVLGELDIPGFSLYLQAHGTDRLIGLGFQTEDSGEKDITRAFFQGLLVQLFDVSKPTAPTRLFATDLGKRGSYSEATQDHHAFYYDQANDLMAIPAVLFDDDAQTTATTGMSGSASSIFRVNSAPNGQKTNVTRAFSG
ncbi:MAG: beta-propeller domain-containing protein, partial [Proteobacteria bacterium]|nr:beta-propeller domain-containing protein [Pseudomonadota bacterium]